MAKNYSVSVLLKLIDQMSAPLNNISKKLISTGKTVSNFGRQWTMSVTTPLLIGGGLLINQFQKQEQAEAKLNAIIRATGGAAGFTAKELQEYAKQLQSVTKHGDETVLNTQAILATFREIKGETFKRATETILDMSDALGQDLKSSAIQLGKALNDPITGVTALRRVGVQMTEQQEEQIKKFMELGDIVSAQNIILKELEMQLGGTARAMANTSSGALAQLKNRLGDLAEEFGKLLLEVLPPIIEVIENFAKWLESLDDETKKFIISAGLLAAALGPVLMVVGGLVTAIGALVNPIGLVVAGFSALVIASQNFQKKRVVELVAHNLNKAANEGRSVNDELQKMIKNSGLTKDEVLSIANANKRIKELLEEENKERIKGLKILFTQNKLQLQAGIQKVIGLEATTKLMKEWEKLLGFIEDVEEKSPLKKAGDDANDAKKKVDAYNRSLLQTLFTSDKLKAEFQRSGGYGFIRGTEEEVKKILGRNYQGQNNKTELTVKVKSENGTSAVIDNVKNKEGESNINIYNEALLGAR